MSIITQLSALRKQLLPTGRAFWVPSNGYMDKLFTALEASENRFYDDAVSILDSALPDNDNFTAQDATDWEVRLGLITNSSVPLADRKLAILRKMAHPGTIRARQNYLYLQGQLQDAGFDVYVHENIFPDYFYGTVPIDPQSLLAGVELADAELGDEELGGVTIDKIANSISRSDDATFALGPTFRSTFFIGGSIFPTYANVDAEREEEFRQLILRIKPVQTIGIPLINYI